MWTSFSIALGTGLQGAFERLLQNVRKSNPPLCVARICPVSRHALQIRESRAAKEKQGVSPKVEFAFFVAGARWLSGAGGRVARKPKGRFACKTSILFLCAFRPQIA